jgi:hypothetical protein
MVYEPGGYNFVDYLKFGIPLQLVCYIFTVAIVFSLEEWWAYAVALAILSPLVVGFYFFFGGDKPSIREPNILHADKQAALEEGHVAHGDGASHEKTAAPSPEAPHNIAPLPIADGNSGADSTPVHAIAQGSGPDPARPDPSSASSALIFTGTA